MLKVLLVWLLLGAVITTAFVAYTTGMRRDGA